MKNLGEPATLHETLERLRAVQPTDRPLWGTMSAGQMVRHLHLACDIALRPGEGPPPLNRLPWLVKFFALKTNSRWPRNLKTTPSLKRAIEAMEPDASFADDRALALARIEHLATRPVCALSHPMFGPMKPADWMRWGYLHADHHLRQFGR